MRTPAFVAAVLFTVVLFVSSASGQEFAKQSESQKQLNKQGVDAMFASDFDRAILSFNSSLTLGELNVTYLNLGRAHAKNGDCAEAKAAYDKVLTSPQVALPTPSEVKVFLDKYLADLDTTKCPGFVTFTCKPMNAKLSIDGGTEAACSSSAVKVAPGEHVAVLALDSRTMEATFTVVAMAKQDLTLELPKKDEVVEKHPEGSTGTMSALGWVGLGAGVASAGTGVALTLMASSERDDLEALQGDPVTAMGQKEAFDLQASADTLATTGAVLLGVGGVLAATGLILLLTDSSDEAAVGVSAVGLPGGFALGMLGRF